MSRSLLVNLTFLRPGAVGGTERVERRAASIAKARELADSKNWSEATDALEQAKRDSITDEEVTEVDELLVEVEYRKYIDMGKRAQRRGQYKGAQTWYGMARDIKHTEEVDELLSEVAQKIAEQEDD